MLGGRPRNKLMADHIADHQNPTNKRMHLCGGSISSAARFRSDHSGKMLAIGSDTESNVAVV